jgi:hypothetical protein
MKTVINNNTMVLQIVTSTQTQVFCNPKEFEAIKKELELVEGYYSVYHFPNGIQKKLSQKAINNLHNKK